MDTAAESLRLSDDINVAVDNAGVTILYSFSNPHHFARISGATRLLLACFPPDQAVLAEDAVNTFLALNKSLRAATDRATVLNIIDRLIEAGILVPEGRSGQIYGPEMVEGYAESRSIPEAVCSTILASGKIDEQTKILDIATGPGSIALQLARISHHVTGIDISPFFLEVARKLAIERQLNVAFRHGDANKLLFEPDSYDVVTLAQAFHWLDPVWATRGVCQVLREGGQYFAIETNAQLPDDHPLKQHIQYGFSTMKEIEEFFATQARNYSQWFELLAGHTFCPRLVDRWILREDRIFDFRFARAFFFTPQVRQALREEREPWSKLQDILDSSLWTNRKGSMYWHVMRFKNLRRDTRLEPCAVTPEVVGIDEVGRIDRCCEVLSRKGWSGKTDPVSFS